MQSFAQNKILIKKQRTDTSPDMEHANEQEQSGLERVKATVDRAVWITIILSIPAYVLSHIYLHNINSSVANRLDYGLTILYKITGTTLAYNIPFYIYHFALKFDFAILVLIPLLAIGNLQKQYKTLNILYFIKNALKQFSGLIILAFGISTAFNANYALPAANGYFYVLLTLLLLMCARYAIIPVFSEKARINPRPAIAAIVLLAFFLRVWNLTGYLGLSNAFVEGQLVYSAGEILAGLVPYRDFIYTHTPLYSYLIAGTFKIFGSGILQARALNAALSTATIIPLYLVAKKAMGDRTAIFAALLWAIHPTALEGGRLLVRETAMVFFMLLGITLLFYRRAETWFFPAGLAIGLAILSKEIAALAVFPVLFAPDVRKKDFLLFILGIAVSVSPMAYFYAVAKEGLVFMLQFHSSTLPLENQELTSRIHTTIFNDSIFFVLIGAVGIANTLRRGGKYADFFLALSLYSGIILAHNTYMWHYAIQLLPFFLVFVSKGILILVSCNSGPEKHNTYAYLGLSLLLMASLLNTTLHISEKNDDRLRVAAELSKNQVAITTISPDMLIPFLAKKSVPGELHEFGSHNRVRNSETSILLLEKYNVSTVVMDRRITDQRRGDLLKGFRGYVEGNYRKTSEIITDFGNVSVWMR